MSDGSGARSGRTAGIADPAAGGHERDHPALARPERSPGAAPARKLRRPFPEPPPAWCCAPLRLEISPLTIRLEAAAERPGISCLTA